MAKGWFGRRGVRVDIKVDSQVFLGDGWKQKQLKEQTTIKITN